jgi:cytochrome c
LSRTRSAAIAVALMGCDRAPPSPPYFDPGPVPQELAEGERGYERNCRACHGRLGSGTEAGPPLVHRIYEPGHHADAAFQLAVRRGVRAHHWSFGNMPPIPAMDSAGIAAVTGYVRWLQQRAGIR